MSIQFGFSFADSTGDHEAVIHKFNTQEIPTWDEALSQFLDFLGTCYGYSIKDELRADQAPQATP